MGSRRGRNEVEVDPLGGEIESRLGWSQVGTRSMRGCRGPRGAAACQCRVGAGPAASQAARWRSGRALAIRRSDGAPQGRGAPPRRHDHDDDDDDDVEELDDDEVVADAADRAFADARAVGVLVAACACGGWAAGSEAPRACQPVGGGAPPGACAWALAEEILAGALAEEILAGAFAWPPAFPWPLAFGWTKVRRGASSLCSAGAAAWGCLGSGAARGGGAETPPRWAAGG